LSSDILQIISAQPGWEAVYAYEQFDDDRNFDVDVGDYVEQGGYAKVQLVCWALVKRAGKTVVIGMIQNTQKWQDAALAFVDEERKNFLGYNHPDCDLDWTFKAAGYRTDSLGRTNNNAKDSG
jgi:hypothetical protein